MALIHQAMPLATEALTIQIASKILMGNMAVPIAHVVLLIHFQQMRPSFMIVTETTGVDEAPIPLTLTQSPIHLAVTEAPVPLTL